MKRCTHDAEARLAALRLENWIALQRRAKWKMAHNIANDTWKWQSKAAAWNPTYDHQYKAYRKPGRQKKRWTDDIVNFLRREVGDTKWILLAKDKARWQVLETKFAKE